jgi:oxygen-dependent protoporphyrinogen oxidase
MKHIVIIGGGITGLATAHRLLERSAESRLKIQVTLLEAGPRVGGIVETHERDGFLLERGPDSFISEKPQALELARRLGLESHLIETNENHRRSFIVRRGRLLPVPEGFHLLAPGRLWPFVTSGIFSWPGKARMAMDLLLPRRNVNGDTDAGSDESLAHFVRRRLGQEALERMAQPMVGGIYTADPETLSLRATMPRFLEMERKHRSLIRAIWKQGESTSNNRVEYEGDEKAASSRRTPKESTSGARYSLFLSFDRGMQFFTDKLAERISDLGSQISYGNESNASAIRVNKRVKSLERERETTKTGEVSKWRVTTTTNETLVADAVCLALPGPVSARLLQDADPQLASELDGISYASSATINLAYKRADVPHALDGFGFVVPFIEKRSMIACTFSSVKFGGRAPEGRVLLRAFVGGALQPEILNLLEGDLISRVRDDLRDLLGIVQPPLFSELTRWDNSMPQYHVGHLEKVKRIQERVAVLPNLTLAGNAYSGPGIPDCIRSGEDAAGQLIATLWSAAA